MNSLIFLLAMSLKNTLLEVFRKPAKLALWVLTVAGLVAILALSSMTRQASGGLIDQVWLKGILFMLLLLFTGLAIRKGLSSGNIIFDMNDVNLLFVSPVSPRKILIYGIVRMARMSLAAGFFIPFQGSSLSRFGVDLGALLLLWLGFVIAVSLLQVVSLVIYVLTNSRPARKRAARLIAIAAFLPLAISLAIRLAASGNLIGALEQTLRSPVFAWTPITGWASEGTIALISGNPVRGVLFFGLLLAVGAALILYITLSNPDYYEDVLVATESAFEKKRKMLEGQINTEGASGQSVKVVKTGIGGIGANAIFRKHLRESFRANPLGLWGMPSLLTVAGAAILSLFFRGDDGGIVILLQFLMWAQIFMIGTGRGLKELYSHYIYLIPESAFAKIIWSSLEVVFKVLVESIVIFGIAGAIMGENIVLVIAVTVLYTLFSLLLLGINYLALRWTGTNISAGLLIFIYVLAVILIMLPGLVAAIVIGSAIEGIGFLVGLGILALWELIAALGCFALSKGILHHSDMPSVRMGP